MATLRGTVLDPNGAVVPAANITVTEVATGLQRTATTNDQGYFTIPLLKPNTYLLQIEHQGFLTAEVRDIVLNVGDERALQIQMKVGDIKETVNVTAGSPLINESPAVGTVVDREFVENMPLNGRSFQSLITLTPGVVLTHAGPSEQGQFSVNGQRADANYFMVDGVSANIGTPVVFFTGQDRSGSLPGRTAGGGFNNLVSLDALQEFRVTTSGFAPEFGRTPGGQISISTRSGTKDFHGTAFDYLRNDVLDANDWFANAAGLARAKERQNDFGVTLGGPVLLPRFGEGGHQPGYNGRKGTFFFSYEGLRLRLPTTATADVPSLRVRANATAAAKPFLNAYPLPTGTENVATGYAPEVVAFSNSSILDATSIRIDHVVNQQLTIFGRYNYSPSELSQRGPTTFALSSSNLTRFKTETLTASAIYVPTSRMTNDLRFNYSRNDGFAGQVLDNFGGATPIDVTALVPQPYTQANSIFFFNLTGARLGQLATGKNTRNIQRQFNLVDTAGFSLGTHQLRFGVDIRRSAPDSDLRAYSATVAFSNANNAALGVASSGNIQSTVSPVILIYHNFSTFGQDTWRIGRRLTLTYGLRWDVNPAPKSGTGLPLASFTGVNNPSSLALAPAGNVLYQTRWNGIAPRLGISYQMRQKSGLETIIRGGVGVFYDTGNQTTGGIPNGFPYTATKTLTGILLPLNATQLTAPVTPGTLPTTSITFAYDPQLKLPKTYQWNLQVEQSLGNSQVVSLAYVGAAGRDLLRQVTVFRPNASFQTVNLTLSNAASDYHALQVQFQRRMARGVQALASYTWSHSIDDVSSDSLQTLQQVSDPKVDRGPSDFDIRHTFSGALRYEVPSFHQNRLLRSLSSGWALDVIVSARTADPVNVTLIRPLAGSFFSARPNLVGGVPLYLYNASKPGGRVFNPAAFVEGPVAGQGTLPRNALRGFPLKQVDFAVSRSFALGTERLHLQAKAEIFNVFNHPNFADPAANFGTDLGAGFIPQTGFGVSAQMFNKGLGSGGQTGGYSPLYQVGGPRSIQLSMKLIF